MNYTVFDLKNYRCQELICCQNNSLKISDHEMLVMKSAKGRCQPEAYYQGGIILPAITIIILSRNIKNILCIIHVIISYKYTFI